MMNWMFMAFIVVSLSRSSSCRVGRLSGAHATVDHQHAASGEAAQVRGQIEQRSCDLRGARMAAA
jgi:hypothetical protein